MSGNLFELYKEYRGHKGTIFSLALQKNSGILFSGANDGMVKAWNTKSHDEKTAVDDTQDRCVWSLACDEEYLFCGGGKAMVKMYDCQTFSVVSSQMFGAEHKSWDMMGIWDLAVHPEERMVYAASSHSIKMFRYARGGGLEFAGDLETDSPGLVRSLDINRGVLFAGCSDESVRIYNLSKQEKPLMRVINTSDQEASVTRELSATGIPLAAQCKSFVAIAAMDNRLFNATGDASIKVNLAKNYEHQQTLNGHDGTVSALCCGEHPDVLFSGGKDSVIRFWRQGEGFAEEGSGVHSIDSPIFKRGA